MTLIERPSSTNAKLYDITQDSTLINCLGHEHALELCGIYNEQFKEKYYSNKISSACPSIQVINIRTPFFLSVGAAQSRGPSGYQKIPRTVGCARKPANEYVSQSRSPFRCLCHPHLAKCRIPLQSPALSHFQPEITHSIPRSPQKRRCS